MPVPPKRRHSNYYLKENVHDKYAPLQGSAEVRFYVTALQRKHVTGFSNNYCLNTDDWAEGFC